MTAPPVAPKGGTRRLIAGVATLAVFIALIVGVFEKQKILATLRGGDHLKADFAQDYKLDVDSSQVKIAGTVVGIVTGVKAAKDGSAVVDMKVDDDVLSKIGTTPTAIIRPTTVLGGRYYVELRPGGSDGRYSGATIPRSRTSTPVELNDVLSALQPSAVKGLQSVTGELDDTLTAGGTPALRSLLAHAPGTLAPATGVITALEGFAPDTDLNNLVTYLDATAVVLSRHDGQLGRVVDELNTTAATLAGVRQPLADTLAALPSTLSATRSGLSALGVTFDKLQAVAGKARPTVAQLNTLLTHLQPVLVRALPVVADLRPLLDDARPLVDSLVTTTTSASTVLDDVKGQPLQRVKGPIVAAVNAKWKGTGSFAGGGGNGHTLYQELGYLGANADNDSRSLNQNGTSIGFQPGIGPDSLIGPAGFNELMNALAHLGGAPGAN